MIQRKFLPGEEWIYIKIYSGPSFVDEILIDHVYKLTLGFFEKDLIDKFFFIRFHDDSFHLRLRFHLKSLDYISHILPAVNSAIKDFVSSRMISKVVLDTYSREIERYGEQNIPILEELFTYDSLRILADLNAETNAGKERWLTGLKSLDHILELFGFDEYKKEEFYESYYRQYALEFGAGKFIKESFKKKQRQYAKLIENEMENKVRDTDLDHSIIEMRDRAIAKLSENFKDDPSGLDFFLKSFSHMHYNRVIRNKQRFHEYIIYYLMSNYYRSQIARKKR